MEDNRNFATFFADAPKGKKNRSSSFVDCYGNFARCAFCAGISDEL